MVASAANNWGASNSPFNPPAAFLPGRLGDTQRLNRLAALPNNGQAQTRELRTSGPGGRSFGSITAPGAPGAGPNGRPTFGDQTAEAAATDYANLAAAQGRAQGRFRDIIGSLQGGGAEGAARLQGEAGRLGAVQSGDVDPRFQRAEAAFGEADVGAMPDFADARVSLGRSEGMFERSVTEAATRSDAAATGFRNLSAQQTVAANAGMQAQLSDAINQIESNPDLPPNIKAQRVQEVRSQHSLNTAQVAAQYAAEANNALAQIRMAGAGLVSGAARDAGAGFAGTASARAGMAESEAGAKRTGAQFRAEGLGSLASAYAQSRQAMETLRSGVYTQAESYRMAGRESAANFMSQFPDNPISILELLSAAQTMSGFDSSNNPGVRF